MILKNAYILNNNFIFSKQNLCVENGKFSLCSNDNEVVDCEGLYIVPGLIDIHTHGALEYDNTDVNSDSIFKIAEFMLNSGVTSYAPTLHTETKDHYIKACHNIINYKESGERFSKIIGIHMEGPYFSLAKVGAQNAVLIRKPDIAEFKEIKAEGQNLIKLISLAPELEGAEEFIKKISKTARISLGHTDCDYETAKKAYQIGASQLTHTFNAMRPLLHRNPGALGAALENDKVFCECICDGVHVHESVVRILLNAVGSDRLILITDSVRGTGLPDGVYNFDGEHDVYIKGNKCTLEDGTINGGVSTLLYCVKKMIEFGVQPEIAFKCATKNPAMSMNVFDRVGSIDIGKDADFLVLDRDFNLCDVYKNGLLINRKK